MTRIRRTFIAAVAATAVTASMGIGAPQAQVAQTSACTYSIWKVTNRQNVSCRKAKSVLKSDKRLNGGDASGHPGWKCTYGKSIIPEGKCTKTGTNKSFKYSQK
jgi:hypothetical protein